MQVKTQRHGGTEKKVKFKIIFTNLCASVSQWLYRNVERYG